MAVDTIPLERPFNLGNLGRVGAEIVVTPPAAELKRLAHWAGVSEVESFNATVSLKRLSSTRFSYDAELEAKIVQDCVVTLQAVRSVLSRRIHRDLHLADRTHAPGSKEVVVDPTSPDDDVREEIASPRYDLAGPLLEELVLAIDPYPRAPGVAFQASPETEAVRTNPFAVLKNLNKQE